MVFEKVITVDGRAHMLGRLASVIAKELLLGQHVVVVRCEQIIISGSLVRNKVKFAQFLKKRTNTNPKKGPIHYRSPARMFWRVVRGMLPHKTYRGQQALSRLQCYEGIPTPWDKKKKVVVPAALKVLRLKPGRRHCLLGRLASEFGWKHAQLIEKMEAKRRVRAAEFYAEKKSSNQRKALAEKEADLSKIIPVLEKFGHYIHPAEKMEEDESAAEAPAAEPATAEPATASATAGGGDY
mmetsp:Transcript_6829/g.9551  ORF Transcript_6829/g.9551 Transcript_6829/m.9551 type:complete len:239 (-) Transcript_6829:550-1266(-)|eukprot:CAMPEP_0197287954 /NCGR_PEP_ID=MMETSP0890-20130614/4820_1 /TAXON_ID=44058 ORGANISM="Aureoumbra lagunensis, Strain CCMP1510" /NCGR_SAMPLE_ID=MMETSP0890 /ASSEMBLY_ACC=CAM_ASM_000533 /LENGTH=238 /DNA_ID=CAMNT_0042758233 /DNA_START=80 /DNA_END=796 /DNA_ORIENTATION=-